MNKAVVVFIVVSLLGLMVIQVGLLRIGQMTEMDEYDMEVMAIMHNIRTDLYENTALSADIARIAKQPTTISDSISFLVKKELDTLFKEQLAARGISVNYAFALTNSKNEVWLSSKRFDKEKFRFNRYTARLGLAGTLCNCEILLHFYQNNLPQYLFRQLAYLLIPSLLFLVFIVGGFAMLIYTVNRQKQLLKVKNDFINNLTHELKTPVFSISLLTKVFREKMQKGQHQQLGNYLNLLEKENEKLKGHIDKVLELASLENGKHHLQKENCDLHEIITEAVAGFSVKIQTSQAQLHQAFQATRPHLLADRIHLKSVVYNLLDNALKYTTAQPIIKISTTNEKEHLQLKISDNGVGIAPEHQPHLFDKFYRVTSGNIHPVKGFGLGLSYVKYIVEAHGGTIAVNSKINKGTTFTILFPCFDKSVLEK